MNDSLALTVRVTSKYRSIPYHEVPGNRQFVDNVTEFTGRKSATSAMMSDGNIKMEVIESNFAGVESAVPRGRLFCVIALDHGLCD